MLGNSKPLKIGNRRKGEKWPCLLNKHREHCSFIVQAIADPALCPGDSFLRASIWPPNLGNQAVTKFCDPAKQPRMTVEIRKVINSLGKVFPVLDSPRKVFSDSVGLFRHA